MKIGCPVILTLFATFHTRWYLYPFIENYCTTCTMEVVKQIISLLEHVFQDCKEICSMTNRAMTSIKRLPFGCIIIRYETNTGLGTLSCQLQNLTNMYESGYWSCEFESHSGEVYSIQRCVIKFVSDLRQVDGFLPALQFPSPIKLTTTI